MAWSVVAADRLDGIASAAILLRAARIRNIPVKVHWLAKELPELTGTIFFLDFSPDEVDLIPASIAYWSCHQPISQKRESEAKARTKFVDFVGPMHSCSAELVQKRFLPNDAVAETIASLARDVEFWLRKDERSLKLADLIASGYEKRTIADSLSKGAYWSDYWEKERLDYLEKKQHALGEMMKHLSIKLYGSVRIGFTFAPNFLSTADACQYLLDKHDGIDVAAIIFRDSRIAFRRRDEGFADCLALANAFGGGGQQFASGARLPFAITLDSLKEAIFYVDKTLKEKGF